VLDRGGAPAREAVQRGAVERGVEGLEAQVAQQRVVLGVALEPEAGAEAARIRETQRLAALEFEIDVVMAQLCASLKPSPPSASATTFDTFALTGT